MLALLLGCVGPAPDDSAPAAGFSLLARKIPGGPLLSAWTDGDALRMVGGQPGGDAGTLARWDGERLCVETAADRPLWWINGPRAGEWYAVGEGGRIVHETDGVRVREDVPTDATLWGVWADGDVAWAVGGTITSEGSTGEVWVRRDGAWSALATDLGAAAYKVWDGWIVGDGKAWRLDGDTLTEVDAGGGRLLTVRGRADDDVWAVGGSTQAAVRHWDGAAWTDVDASALGQPLNGVWTGPGEDVWVAGNFGTAAVLRDDGWETPETPPSNAHWHATWRQADETFWVGGDLYGTGDGTGEILRYGDASDEVTAEDCGPTAALSLPFVSRAEAATPVRAGDPAPDLSVPTLDGATLALAGLRGEVVVLNFWATWCAPCLDELPRLDALGQRLAGSGARVVTVNIDRASGPVKGAAARLGLRVPVGLDPASAAVGRFAPPALPTTYVIDRSGTVRAVHAAALAEADVAALEREVRALVGAP